MSDSPHLPQSINSGGAQLHERLRQMTSDRGPDVSVEAIGLPATFRSAVEETAFCGRVVYVGYAKEPVCYEGRLFVQKELDILGSRNAMPDDFRAVIQMLHARQLHGRSAGLFHSSDPVRRHMTASRK